MLYFCSNNEDIELEPEVKKKGTCMEQPRGSKERVCCKLNAEVQFIAIQRAKGNC